MEKKKNHLFQRHVTDSHIWVFDETFLGRKGVFSVVNLFSGACVGLILSTEDSRLTSGEILELFKEMHVFMVDPVFLHGDSSPLYESKELQDWCKEVGIAFSFAVGMSFGNQVSESFNNSLKQQIATRMLTSDIPEINTLKRLLSTKQKKFSTFRKARDKEIRALLWDSQEFQDHYYDYVLDAARELNLRDSPLYKNFTRKEMELQCFLSELHNPKLYKKETVKANLLIEKTEVILHEAEIANLTLVDTIREALQPGQQQLSDQLAAGLGALYLENKAIKDELFIQRTLREEKNKRRLKRLARKTRPKKTAVQREHLDFVLNASRTQRGYKASRLRVALTLLYITGVRASELLSIKSGQVEQLLVSGSIPITRKKRGETQKLAHLHGEGKLVLKLVQNDIALLLTGKESPEDFFFTAEGAPNALSREHFQRLINNALQELKANYPHCYFSSHSFRAGFITNLWKKGVDLSTISQIIGHKRIETTSLYLTKLEEGELKQAMDDVGP